MHVFMRVLTALHNIVEGTVGGGLIETWQTVGLATSTVTKPYYH